MLQAAAASADSNGQKESILSFCKSVAESYEALLSNVLATNQQPTDQNLKQKLIPLSKSVATAVSNLVRAGEDMKGKISHESIFFHSFFNSNYIYADSSSNDECIE